MDRFTALQVTLNTMGYLSVNTGAEIGRVLRLSTSWMQSVALAILPAELLRFERLTCSVWTFVVISVFSCIETAFGSDVVLVLCFVFGGTEIESMVGRGSAFTVDDDNVSCTSWFEVFVCESE